MPLPVHNFGSKDYDVSIHADAADLDKILSVPAFVAFFAALADARAARAAFKAAEVALGEAVLAEERDREARLESTPEGVAFQAADDVLNETHEACSLAGEALSQARAQDAINRLLGRDAEPLTEDAIRSLNVAVRVKDDASTERRRAERAFAAVCVEAREAHQQARTNWGARHREMRDADIRLREAAKPLAYVVHVYGHHW